MMLSMRYLEPFATSSLIRVAEKMLTVEVIKVQKKKKKKKKKNKERQKSMTEKRFVIMEPGHIQS